MERASWEHNEEVVGQRVPRGITEQIEMSGPRIVMANSGTRESVTRAVIGRRGRSRESRDAGNGD